MRSKPLQFGLNLSPEEHEILVKKVISIFEGDLSQAVGEGPIPKMTVDQLWQHRWVVQSWMQTIKDCAKADLDENNFKTVAAAVQEGDALDSQIVTALRGFPLEFGLTMLPDVKCLTDAGEDHHMNEDEMIEKAEKEEWLPGLYVFAVRSFVRAILKMGINGLFFCIDVAVKTSEVNQGSAS